MNRRAFVNQLLALSTFPLVARAAVAVAAPAAGKVTGRISLGGKIPARKLIKPTQDAAVCGRKPMFEETIVAAKDGGLANVVVSLEGAGGGEPMASVLLDQRDCVFVPHVLCANVGTTLVVKNSDPILNSPHAYIGKRTLFNVAQPLEGMEFKRKLKKPGMIKMTCDVHQWESAYIWVFDNARFTVTGTDGGFTLAGVPAGTYPIVCWHESLGEKRGEVTVPAGGNAEFSLSY